MDTLISNDAKILSSAKLSTIDYKVFIVHKTRHLKPNEPFLSTIQITTLDSSNSLQSLYYNLHDVFAPMILKFHTSLS